MKVIVQEQIYCAKTKAMYYYSCYYDVQTPAKELSSLQYKLTYFLRLWHRRRGPIFLLIEE